MDDWLMRMRAEFGAGFAIGNPNAHVKPPDPEGPDPRSARSAAYEGLGRMDTYCYREWIAPECPLVGNTDDEWEWLENVPRGPSTEGVERIEYHQQKWGATNVTAGTANPPDPALTGLYVRVDLL